MRAAEFQHCLVTKAVVEILQIPYTSHEQPKNTPKSEPGTSRDNRFDRTRFHPRLHLRMLILVSSSGLVETQSETDGKTHHLHNLCLLLVSCELTAICPSMGAWESAEFHGFWFLVLVAYLRLSWEEATARKKFAKGIFRSRVFYNREKSVSFVF